MVHLTQEHTPFRLGLVLLESQNLSIATMALVHFLLMLNIDVLSWIIVSIPYQILDRSLVHMVQCQDQVFKI